MNFNNREDRFQSIAICSKMLLTLDHILTSLWCILNNFSKTHFWWQNHKVIGIIQKKFSTINQFLWLVTRVYFYNTVDIVIRDFNINALHENNSLLRVLSAYNQVVTKSTHISGSLLDHVYVHKEFSRTLSVYVIDIYFSYHNAVKPKFIWHFNMYINLLLSLREKRL